MFEDFLIFVAPFIVIVVSLAIAFVVADKDGRAKKEK